MILSIWTTESIDKMLIWIYILYLWISISECSSDIRILASDKDFIRLTWTKPTRFTSAIYGYTVKYRPLNSNNSWIVQQTNETDILLSDLRPITKYEIIVQPYLNASYTTSAGPSTRIEAITDETGNTRWFGWLVGSHADSWHIFAHNGTIEKSFFSIKQRMINQKQRIIDRKNLS